MNISLRVPGAIPKESVKLIFHIKAVKCKLEIKTVVKSTSYYRYKSSRILGLEDALIPELRRIEPIPNMSEANLARLQRRRQALEEERRAKIQQANKAGNDEHMQQQHHRQNNDYIVSPLHLCMVHFGLGMGKLPAIGGSSSLIFIELPKYLPHKQENLQNAFIVCIYTL